MNGSILARMRERVESYGRLVKWIDEYTEVILPQYFNHYYVSIFNNRTKKAQLSISAHCNFNVYYVNL
jgi:hypothetical protein